jgi:signal transduction histidine kinase
MATMVWFVAASRGRAGAGRIVDLMRSMAAVPPAVKQRLEDILAVIVAFIIGGVAMDSTEVAASTWAEVNDVIGLLAVAAIWWRRRAPELVAVAVIAGAAAAPLAQGASAVALYTVASLRSARIGAVCAAAHGASMAVNAVAFPDTSVGTGWSVFLGLVITMCTWGWGLVAGSRRELMASMAERAERAEAEQRARLAEARRLERSRIAAEMHDVLAHRLSMLSLHAGAIETRPDAPTEQLAEAAKVVRDSAHLALEELRTVLGVLRRDGTIRLAPLPSMAEIGALVDESRHAGMRLSVDWNGLDPASVPAGLGRHLYRIVQEGLTNARKHGRGQPVVLSLAGAPGRCLSVSITNRAGPAGIGAGETGTAREPTGETGTARDPTGVSAASSAGSGAGGWGSGVPPPGAGLGLVGLQERVALAGGRLSCQTDGSGMHRLCVELPWPA